MLKERRTGWMCLWDLSGSKSWTKSEDFSSRQEPIRLNRDETGERSEVRCLFSLWYLCFRWKAERKQLLFPEPAGSYILIQSGEQVQRPMMPAAIKNSSRVPDSLSALNPALSVDVSSTSRFIVICDALCVPGSMFVHDVHVAVRWREA